MSARLPTSRVTELLRLPRVLGGIQGCGLKRFGRCEAVVYEERQLVMQADAGNVKGSSKPVPAP